MRKKREVWVRMDETMIARIDQVAAEATAIKVPGITRAEAIRQLVALGLEAYDEAKQKMTAELEKAIA